MATAREYISRTDLKKERGWTDRLMREFLPDADKEFVNTFGKPSKLYLFTRVIEIEASSEYKARLPEIYRLKARADKTIRSRENKTIEWAENVPIKLLQLDMFDLYKRALRWKEVTDFSAISEDIAKRWMVNYLRHHCTDYDGLTTAGLYNKVGRHKAYRIIRERTLILIGTRYPILSEAAQEQVIRYKQRRELPQISVR